MKGMGGYMEKTYDFSRYLKAQAQDYDVALKEIKEGYKRSHWMWYVFPQIIGLGQSRTSIFYSIQDLDEAKAYMEDETLRKHMLDICEALVGLETSDATHVFGSPDDVKLHSSMTLFKAACPDIDIFQKVIDKFFAGKDDRRTIEIISWKQQ
jgi:uncharacterized protein (DUF1810 family)